MSGSLSFLNSEGPHIALQNKLLSLQSKLFKTISEYQIKSQPSKRSLAFIIKYKMIKMQTAEIPSSSHSHLPSHLLSLLHFQRSK